MTPFFYGLGFVVAAVGIGWCALVAVQPMVFAPAADAVGKLLAMSPGFAIMGSGFVFLALGGILGRLDRIADNTELADEARR